MKDLPLLEILKIITTSCNFTQMYGFIKILEYSTEMNRLRKETCTLPEHNIPSREREREKNFLGTSSILALGKSSVGLPPLLLLQQY